ncbi:IclR family transcriptional regulator [Desulforamulus ruminis]|uniref:Glycerol operon regulatory protein n=1 Tax=Desulforamulus ruminis (strain ATCC 23193 / DSM 2154 / NCIMB 8452 / DL) TaxID=696281 RepID=F6DN70_DESRL|nr:IclR family transcriptional regulator [Desulforamulus ruminis]AEG60659.1 Transcriptional regulator IclR [Desulforamulus ruminis DSM 2154]
MTTRIGQTVQSLERALKILEVLGNYQKGLGVTELAHEVDLHKSTVHRLLGTLAQRGFVEQDSETERYKLGLKIIELSNKMLTNMEVRQEARPFLEELMQFANEVVHLCVLRQGEIVYIDKVECPSTIRMYSQVGRRGPVHSTGVGKAILAFLPQEEVVKILQEKGMPRKTPNTITDIDEMLKHLAEIKLQGFSIDEVENELGIRCVAAPVWDHSGQVIASISVAGPESRVTRERVPELAAKIRETGLKISHRLGYCP